MFRVLLAAVVAAGILAAAGCIAIGAQTDNRATTGQELIDLKAALDRGAVSPEEYAAKKAELLARR
jgi:hypothetical protein